MLCVGEQSAIARQCSKFAEMHSEALVAARIRTYVMRNIRANAMFYIGTPNVHVRQMFALQIHDSLIISSNLQPTATFEHVPFILFQYAISSTVRTIVHTRTPLTMANRKQFHFNAFASFIPHP